jgi:hypothetical protein
VLACRRGEHGRDHLRRKVGATPLNMGNPNPSPMVRERCAKRGADSTSPCRSHRKDLRPVCSHPRANSPIGHASGSGANHRALGAGSRGTRTLVRNYVCEAEGQQEEMRGDGTPASQAEGPSHQMRSNAGQCARVGNVKNNDPSLIEPSAVNESA